MAQALAAFQTLLGPSTMLSYLSMMAPRLVELRRVLKHTGSLYLHCDPTASHYLKLLLDAVFGPENFRNEIIWERTSSHNMKTKGFVRSNDVLLFFTRSDSFTFNGQFAPYGPEQMRRYKTDENGRQYKAENLTFSTANPSRQFEWRGAKPPANRSWGASKEQLEAWYGEGRILVRRDGVPRLDGLKVFLDQTKGKPLATNWTDIQRIGNTAGERLGYPTQKPLALLERIIEASSNPGDTVLDPFCGCGTTIAAAEKLKRNWIGIDLTALAISLIKSRLAAAGADDYKVFGEPTTADDAAELARTDPYGFQWWALGLIGARPAEGKKGADRGIDGRLFFFDDDAKPKQVIVSVKAGKVSVPQVRDLVGVLDREKAQIGVLISFNEATGPMRAEAASAGFHTSGLFGDFPRVQLLTVAELLAGQTIKMPNSGNPQGMTVALPPAPEEVHPDQMTLG